MKSNKPIEYICLGSGSTGNAYVLRKDDECVLVECGFEFKVLVQKLIAAGIDAASIKAVIVTHKHGDHAKSIHKFISFGVPTYAPESALDDIEPSKDNVHVIKDKSRFDLVSWLKVYCFSVDHDVEAYGFIFYDPTNKESTLFINDTKMFDFKLKDMSFNYIFIECNHIRKQVEAMLNDALLKGNQGEVFKLKRQASYHMSLAACKKFLRLMDLTNTKGIFLMHLSKDACNDEVVRAEIKSVFGIPTFICHTQGGIS